MSEAAEQRHFAAGWTRGEFAIALVGLAWVALAALWAAPGVFIVDGFTYLAMIDAFARDGSFFVENGLEEYGSDALKLHLMREVGGRLAPQYPGGWGILAAPAYLAGGVRGVILLNAVASALTLPLVWQAARALFEDRSVATSAALIYGLATFAVDYAVGFWPHGVSTFLVTAAVAAVATGQRGPPSAELRGALVAGLALGVGVNIRVDAVFYAAPLGLWLLGAGRRPYLAAACLVVGLMPGLVVATAINHLKFDALSPTTYGHSIGSFSRVVPLVVAAGVAALALGLRRIRNLLYQPAGLALVASSGIALCLALPSQRELLFRIAEGFWVRVIDFQAYPAPALGLTEMEDGTIRMYGRVKKALLQSVPYAAVLLVLLPRLFHGPDRRSVAFCFLFVALGIGPFAFISWHGGMGNNMRYFLNIMPLLAVLSAVALREIAMISEHRKVVSAAAAMAVGAAALVYAAARGYPWVFALQNTLPNAVAGTIAVLSILLLLTHGALRRTFATMVRGIAAFALLTAFLLGWLIDVQFTNLVRARNAELAALAAGLPQDALVITFTPDTAGLRVNRPPALTAQANHLTMDIDPAVTDLVARVFAEERSVFAQGQYLAKLLIDKGAADSFTPRYGILEAFEFYEMTPPRGGQDEKQ